MFKKKEATKLTKKDCLTDIYNQTLFQCVTIETEIAILEDMPEDFIVGDKAVSQIIGGVQGKVSIKAKEAINIKQKQLFMLNQKLKSIDKLLSVV